MLWTPSAWAPSRRDSSPATDMSRVVRCGIVSIPQARSIATEAMTPLMRGRARGLSLASTQWALAASQVPLARLAERGARLDERAVVRPERRIELDRDDELLLAEHPGEPGLLR